MKSENSMGNAKSLFGKRPFGLDNFLGSFSDNFKENKKLAPKKALSKALPQKFTPQNLRPKNRHLKILVQKFALYDASLRTISS